MDVYCSQERNEIDFMLYHAYDPTLQSLKNEQGHCKLNYVICMADLDDLQSPRCVSIGDWRLSDELFLLTLLSAPA